MAETPRILIDACVLFARIPRRLVLNAAEAGLLAPFWSVRVLEEWRIATARKGGDEVEARSLAMAMNTRWPDAVLAPQPDLEHQLDLPDMGDAHVIAAAAGRVPEILTFNIRDFPRRTIAGLGLVARHPDEFLWQLASDHPREMIAIVAPIAAEHGAETGDDVRKLLKRALLPRFGKALAAEW